MSRDHAEIAHRLETAYRRTREAYEVTFKGHDQDIGTEIASVWPFITVAYSGIEQTFKFHIAEKCKKTVEQLVASRGYRHHDLGKLFACLKGRVRKAVAEEYRRFRTLHPHIEPKTADDFLRCVSAKKRPSDEGDGRGYQQWRYSLTAPERDEDIPRNSVEALLLIWDVAVQLCETERGGWRPRGVYERMSEGIEGCLDHIALTRPGLGEGGKRTDHRDMRRESIAWLSRHGCVVNGFAKLIHREYRGLPPDADADGLSDFLADSREAWVSGQDGGRVTARSDIGMFVARARGSRGRGQGVRWNGETNGFEDIPWALAGLTEEKPPRGAFRFEDDGHGAHRRRQMMRWVFGRGFDVKENYPARGDMPAGKWLCTLRGEKDVASGKLVVGFWEHPNDGGFRVEVAGGEDAGEGRLVREVMRLKSESTHESGPLVVRLPDDGAGS